jgi:DNA-binding beta-propeller fold protein YncE
MVSGLDGKPMGMRSIVAIALVGATMVATMKAQDSVNYHLLKKVPIAADGTFDYLAVDGAGRRLYVSHGTEVDVFDMDSDQFVGAVEGMVKVHGIVAVPQYGHGFITSGGNSTVKMFDLKTLASIKDIPAPGGPDGILYEPKTDRVFAFDHRQGHVTVINAKDGSVAGGIEIGGMPEFPATDEQGSVWVGLEDESKLVKIDAMSMKVAQTMPLAPCDGPTGMDMDRKNRRLFIGCGNEKMAVVDADKGSVIATVPIGVHVDATWFDRETKLIFNANRATITVIRQEGSDKYEVVQTVSTLGHANTLAIDPKNHRVFATTSMYKTDPAANGGKATETAIPGTATLLIYEP